VKCTIASIHLPSKLIILLLFSLCFVNACADFDQLMKPRVEGLLLDTGFNGASLRAGGVGEIHLQSSLTEQININTLETILITAIRQKRRDVTVRQDGRYQITANLIANDVTQWTETFKGQNNKWTKRRVKVNYSVIETASNKQVWGGLIETSREELASYDIENDKKLSEKVHDVLTSLIIKREVYPYPSPPLFDDIAKLNFEGFALNLPVD
jgi:hypothetical protein